MDKIFYADLNTSYGLSNVNDVIQRENLKVKSITPVHQHVATSSSMKAEGKFGIIIVATNEADR